MLDRNGSVMTNRNQIKMNISKSGISVKCSLYEGTYDCKDILKSQGFKFENYGEAVWAKEVVIVSENEVAALQSAGTDAVVEKMREAKTVLEQIAENCPLTVVDATDKRIYAQM